MPVRRTRTLAACAASAVVLTAAVAAADDAPSSATAGPTPLERMAEAGPALPQPDVRLPTREAGIATALADTTVRLRDALTAWDAGADLETARPPEDVTLLALHHQRLVFSLVGQPRLTARVVARLPETVRGEIKDTMAARESLRRIKSGPIKVRPKLKTGPALPPGELRGLYEAAEKRFGVRWELLASVNFVETAFNKLRNQSTAGAQGPMQFIPATWRAYGMGGNIRDPRDAIMGAANYLKASGAPGNERRALFAYNNSDAYVSAILLHARRIAKDPQHFLTLYSWQVFVRRDGKLVRLTGPGL